VVRRDAHDDAVADHANNPEHELHCGRITIHPEGDRRYVSLWLSGQRWCGWLTAGEPNGDDL